MLHARETHFRAVNGIHDPRFIHVIQNVDKRHKPRPSLQDVKIVLRMRIPAQIAFTGKPNVKTVTCMIKNWKSDEKNFNGGNVRKAAQKFDFSVIGRRPMDNKRIGEHMFEEKNTDGKNTG